VRAQNADCTSTHSTKKKINVGPSMMYESELDLGRKYFNLIPSFPGYEIAQHLLLLDPFSGVSVCALSFFLFWISSSLPLQNKPITRVTCVLHAITLCYIRSAVARPWLPAYAFSLFIILGLSAIAISDSILAKDVSLNRSKVCICFEH